MVFLIIFAAVTGYLLLTRAWRLYHNYRGAVASGLPCVVVPIDIDALLFILFQIPLGALSKRVLPTSWHDRLRLAVMGWEFFDKGAIHERLGLTFILVTTGTNQLWCADPAMAQTILSRRKDFVQLPLASKIVSFLGANILTSDGEAWARQRRIIAPNLNERISQVTWDESMAQAHQMADHMICQPGGKSSDTINSLRAIAINVLGQVGYGQPKPFKPMELPRDPDANMTYIDAISLCTELLIVAALLPGWLLRMSFMPRVIRTVGAALKNLPGLTGDMLSQERERIESSGKVNNDHGENTRDNIMSQLVRLSDQGKISDIHNKPTGQYLTDDEIAGNLFVFTAAGFDTTANTMTYAIGMLAAHPEWQSWMQQELDAVIGSAEKKQDASLDYATYFPQMKRVLAVMLETLRFFPAIIHISRSIQHDQSVVVHGRTHTIAGPCTVYINNVGLHFSRTSWGSDAHIFRPSRWLTSADIASAEIITPARGTFLAWSGGPRVCPGQKMAQVEFVTVLSALFARLNVEPAPHPGRSMQESKRDILALMEDSLMRLTLQMNQPEKFLLRWTRR